MSAVPSIEQVKGVVFDLDGTLLDGFPPIINALNQTLKEFGKPVMTAEAIKRQTGRGDFGIKELFPESCEEASVRFLELHDAVYLQQVKMIDGAETALSWLYERSIPAAVVTSKGQQRAEAQIERLGWKKYFQAVVGKADGRPEKPSPIPVQMACAAINLSPAECIMIGDGIGDMKAGSRAGLYTVGIVDSFSKQELEASGASICLSSLHEVYQWLTETIA